MIVYAILLLFIHKILAIDTEVFNVGTVLFSPHELNKNDWSVTDIGLLRARRYFQYVLPHPFLVDPSINNFADSILDYFTNAVNVVKREETDLVSTDILTTAMFDAIGGYMKSYVLPVTKYGYYGGTVSKEDAQKLYQFYDDIKSYLKTDGSGWRTFDGKFQKPLKIIATLTHDYIRDTRESCDLVGFYEETPSGFTIPLPSINFDSHSPVIFVPLRDHPLIYLHSPSSTDTLLNYYHAAKNCLKTRSPNIVAEFEKKFRSWLTDDVIVHLDDDDRLYYALGGILTLATDKENEECSLSSLIKMPVPSRKTYIRINFGSKKVLILTVILFLEVVWCIPALLYMLYRRRKKKKDSCDMLLFVNPNKNKADQFLSSSGDRMTRTRSSMSTSCDENTCESVNTFKKKKFRIDDTRQCPNPNCQNFELQTSLHMVSKGTSDRSCDCPKRSAASYTIEKEFPVTKPIRSALKHTSSVFDVKTSHFAKPRLFQSYNNVKIKVKPSIQNVGVTNLADNGLSLQDDIACKTKDRKSKENILNKSNSSDEQAVIQIDSYDNMGRQRDSNKIIKNQQSFKEMSDLYKSNVDTLTQGRSNNDLTILRYSKDKVNISHKATEEDTALRQPDNSTVIAQNIADKTVSLECHENTSMLKLKENTLQEYKSYDNTINVRQSHAYAVVLRTPNDDAQNQSQQKSIEKDVFIPGKSKHHSIIQNKPNDTLRKERKHDHTTMTVQKLKNKVTYFDSRNHSEAQSHASKPNNTLRMIETLDQKAKILQKSTNELMQLIERRNTCGNAICDCSCCQSLKNDKSYTGMQQLRTCATITLIPDDNSSVKSAQSMETLCRENQATQINLTARPLINTSVLVSSANQTRSFISRSPSSNPIPESSKLNTADVRSYVKEGVKDLTRNTNIKDEKSNTKEERKDSTKKKQEKSEKKKVEEKTEKNVEKSKRSFGFKFAGGKKALFEVRIEKPHTAICVGIARGIPKAHKISRIPTRVTTDNLVRFDNRAGVCQRRPLEAPTRSKIPLPVKKTTDDIVIRHSRHKANTPDPRLNVTL